jgi:hypothetical protein
MFFGGVWSVLLVLIVMMLVVLAMLCISIFNGGDDGDDGCFAYVDDVGVFMVLLALVFCWCC